MRITLTLLLPILLSCSSLFSNIVSQSSVSQKLLTQMDMVSNNAKAARNEVIFYHETFENGIDGWCCIDGTIPPNLFHNYNSPVDGWVWWMGDSALSQEDNNGGYHNHQYLVLDTPVVQVPATNAFLTFRLKYNLESPTGATAPFTGWDACNIRISIDGGNTWSIMVGIPAYNISSAFSFGYEHGEGSNIPGWGGNSNGWVNASFDINSYAGQNVKIRFAFASDDAFDTSESPEMFGMMVDDISIGNFTNDGSSSTGFTAGSLVPVGGQLWHIAEVADAPSPTHAMICQNSSGSYNQFMLNYVVSPSIQLPESGNIKADFKIKGSFDDQSVYPDVDTWGWEISPDNGYSWYPMWNPYNDPSAPNCIIGDIIPATWTSVTELYAGLIDGWISDYAGLTVKFRVFFKTNSTVDGTGILMDDFVISNELPLPPPTSLNTAFSNSGVQLNWTVPIPEAIQNVITSTNENWTTYVSNADAYAMKIVNPGEMPTLLHGVNFMLYRQNSMPIVGTATIHVWADEAGYPGIELMSMNGITGIENFSWKNVDITDFNIMIPAGGSIFIGISEIDPGDDNAQGLLCDATSTNANSFVNIGGEWETLGLVYQGLVNCALSGTIYIADPSTPVLTGYKIWHSIEQTGIYTEIAEINNPTVITYFDSVPVNGVINYYQVTALYGAYQSNPSNSSSIFVLGTDFSELLYDDNEVDQGYGVGTTHSMAVSFHYGATSDFGCEICYMKVFINTVGLAPMVIRVFDANGVNGGLGTQLLQYVYPVANLTPGWNIVPFPINSHVNDMDGIFYIGILEYSSSSVIGLDTDNHNSSWKKMGSSLPWEQITEGNVMIRAIVQTPVGNDDPIEIPSVPERCSNYPNPFNPSTTIEFGIPKTTNVILKIYNIRGQLVRELVNDKYGPGQYNAVWDGKDKDGNSAASGIYFYRLETLGKCLTNKMVLLK